MKTLTTVIAWLIAASMHAQNHETPSRLTELNFLSGVWLVSTETRLSAAGPWESNEGRSTIAKTTGDALLEENFTGVLQSKVFYTKTLFAYNRFSDQFQKVFMDSEHGVLVDYLGTREGNTFYFDKLWVYPNKSTVKLREVYTLLSADEFTVESMRMPENATEWDTTERMRYKRVKE